MISNPPTLACALAVIETRFPSAVFLRTGTYKTLLYQVQTMEIRPPLD
jgi:hypothetical protein